MRHSKLSSESSSGTLYPTKIDVFFEIFQKAFVIFPKNHGQKVHFEHQQSSIKIVGIKNDRSLLPSWKISKKSAILVARTIIAQLNKVF